MAAVEVACQAWADCEGSAAVAAVRALCRNEGDATALAKAVARRLRSFLVQAFSNRVLRYRIRTKISQLMTPQQTLVSPCFSLITGLRSLDPSRGDAADLRAVVA